MGRTMFLSDRKCLTSSENSILMTSYNDPCIIGMILVKNDEIVKISLRFWLYWFHYFQAQCNSNLEIS